MRSLCLILTALLLSGCSAGPSPGASAPTSPGAPTHPLKAADVADAVAGMSAEISCAAPRPRAEDYSWVCSGMDGPAQVTIHLFAASVQGDLFGVTLYAQEGPDEPKQRVADDVRKLTTGVVGIAVPADWRTQVTTWIDGHWPDGGRTRNVPGAGVTAAVQPLADNQWYMEVYELDGLER